MRRKEHKMSELHKKIAHALSIVSKVIRDSGKHITRADYNDAPVLLDSENIRFPKAGSLQARALRRLLPSGATLSHRSFDSASHSYRLSSYIGSLRDKGWTIVDHDEVSTTKDIVPRKAKYTRYELFATFTPELWVRIKLFCVAVDKFEADAALMKSTKQ